MASTIAVTEMALPGAERVRARRGGMPGTAASAATRSPAAAPTAAVRAVRVDRLGVRRPRRRRRRLRRSTCCSRTAAPRRSRSSRASIPTRVERFELIRDSGGPGTFRGGLAPRRVYRILTDDAQLDAARRPPRRRRRSACDGGQPGRSARVIRRTARRRGASLPSRFSGVRLRRGRRRDISRRPAAAASAIRTSGRSKRSLDDVLDGYVSRDAAIADYGVDAERLDEELRKWNDV